MDLMILKKRLSTFAYEGGQLRNVSDELLLDVLRAWESWTGKPREFYTGLGVSRQALSRIITKAKRLSREGAGGEFKEMGIVESVLGAAPSTIGAIEVTWDNGKVIRFPSVDQLIDFLKRRHDRV